MPESLDPLWKQLKPDYKLLRIVGQGTFGTVVHGKHRKSGTEVAIKLIKTELTQQIECRNIYRELTILRQFSQMKNNIFVTQILDVIVASPDPTKC